MRDLITKEIDGHIWSIKQFGTTQSLQVLTKLTKLLGEPMTMLIALGEAEEGSINEMDEARILGQAVRALIEKLDETQHIALIKDLVNACLVDDRKVNFELDFRGNISTLFKVLYAVLEVQYGNFFGEIQGLKESLAIRSK